MAELGKISKFDPCSEPRLARYQHAKLEVDQLISANLHLFAIASACKGGPSFGPLLDDVHDILLGFHTVMVGRWKVHGTVPMLLHSQGDTPMLLSHLAINSLLWHLQEQFLVEL